MGWSHDASLSTEESILRDFDMDMKYGPCCTISRTERWKRASLFGLDPPSKIIDLVGITKNDESVLDMHLRQVSS